MSKKENDSLTRLKYIGYCYSQMPPEEATFEWDDFVNYVKFQLCRINKRLLKDPIWDEYTEEELIVEYYSHLYYHNKEERENFINGLRSATGAHGDIYDWLDSQIEKNQEEMKEKQEQEDGSVSFNPDSLGE